MASSIKKTTWLAIGILVLQIAIKIVKDTEDDDELKKGSPVFCRGVFPKTFLLIIESLNTITELSLVSSPSFFVLQFATELLLFIYQARLI